MVTLAIISTILFWLVGLVTGVVLSLSYVKPGERHLWPFTVYVAERIILAGQDAYAFCLPKVRAAYAYMLEMTMRIPWYRMARE